MANKNLGEWTIDYITLFLIFEGKKQIYGSLQCLAIVSFKIKTFRARFRSADFIPTLLRIEDLNRDVYILEVVFKLLINIWYNFDHKDANAEKQGISSRAANLFDAITNILHNKLTISKRNQVHLDQYVHINEISLCFPTLIVTFFSFSDY
jgi:hypothetical protein